MATAPFYKINDIVYLAESANLGELDAFKIGAIHQANPGRWVYQIFIEKRPPDSQTVEDRDDLRFPRQMFYEEAELLTLCQAVDTALHNLQHRMNNMLSRQAELCGPTFPGPVVPKGDSKFNIGDVIFIKASANKGFLEHYKVTDIHKQPSITEYTYELDIHGTAAVTTNALVLNKPLFRQLFFRESELIDQCEALNTVVVALERKVLRMLSIKETFCPSPEPSSN